MSKIENSKKLLQKKFKEKYNKLKFLLKETKYNKSKKQLKAALFVFIDELFKLININMR